MPLVLDATVGGEKSNSYVAIEFADDFWASHYSAEKAEQWAALTEGQKTSLLIQACRTIETVRFTVNAVMSLLDNSLPTKALFSQALQFPRNIDRGYESGEFYIPESVKLAQCEQAIYLLNLDTTAIENRLQGITLDSVTAGQITMRQEFTSGGTTLSAVALEYLRPFMLRTSSRLRRA